MILWAEMYTLLNTLVTSKQEYFKMGKYGFVYLWRDRKHNRFYVGSHWGTEDDGYVCSSTWMMQAYKRRPQDFKRRILARVGDNRKTLYEEETRFLNMIKEEEIRKRYYNLNIKAAGHWTASVDDDLTIREKISKRTKEAMQRPDLQEKLKAGYAKRDNKSSDPKVIEKRRKSMTKTMAEKFPEENRRKPLTDEERFDYYSNKGKSIWTNRSEEELKEVGAKISKGLEGKQNRLGQTNSEVHRQRISESLKGKIHKRHRISIEDVEYDSSTKASEILGISVPTINRRLKSDKYKKYIRIG